ncbi:MAG: metal-dependent transcriptional regulator [Dehalococcoidia bacterium]|nr:metal-dependent transcriptional regulator [Dehalococcoidia bacterium]
MSTNHVYEEYLEAIYVMEVEGETVIGARLAGYLGVSAPTVTETLQRIVRHGLAVMNDRKEVQLTPKGRERGEIQVRRRVAFPPPWETLQPVLTATLFLATGTTRFTLASLWTRFSGETRLLLSVSWSMWRLKSRCCDTCGITASSPEFH